MQVLRECSFPVSPLQGTPRTLSPRLLNLGLYQRYLEGNLVKRQTAGPTPEFGTRQVWDGTMNWHF